MHTARRHSFCASLILWLTLISSAIIFTQHAQAWTLIDEEFGYYTLQIDDQPDLPKTIKALYLAWLAEHPLTKVAPSDHYCSIKQAPVARGPP